MLAIVRSTTLNAARAAASVAVVLPLVWLHIVKSVLAPGDGASDPPVAEEAEPPRWRIHLAGDR